jgi:hypothetical protein
VKVGDELMGLLYEKYFFDTNIPIADTEVVKSFVAEQFGFKRTLIDINRSCEDGFCHPLFQDNSKNFIVFSVKNQEYSCIDGKLQVIAGRG